MTDTTSTTSVGKLSVLAIVPATLACLTYEVFLGHRHDYTGHFAAGYGGSLGAMMLLLSFLLELALRSHSFLTTAFLLLIGVLLAAGNVWIAAKRSAIPLELHETVAKKEVRREKHPGHDDVHLLYFQSGRVLEVDRQVFEAVHDGERIEKSVWTRELRHGAHASQLFWSRDFQGMTRAMPIAVLILGITALCVQRPLRWRPNDGQMADGSTENTTASC